MRVFASFVVGAFAFLIVGCGESESDKVGKAWLRIAEAETREYEFMAAKPPDPEDIRRSIERLEKVQLEKKDIIEAIKKLPKADSDAMKAKYKPELDKIRLRHEAAVKTLCTDVKVMRKK